MPFVAHFLPSTSRVFVLNHSSTRDAEITSQEMGLAVLLHLKPCQVFKVYVFPAPCACVDKHLIVTVPCSCSKAQLARQKLKLLVRYVGILTLLFLCFGLEFKQVVVLRRVLTLLFPWVCCL